MGEGVAGEEVADPGLELPNIGVIGAPSFFSADCSHENASTRGDPGTLLGELSDSSRSPLQRSDLI
eukprot:scaffold80855_cov60-Phaeocystis_antarctica.AAC.3